MNNVLRNLIFNTICVFNKYALLNTKRACMTILVRTVPPPPSQQTSICRRLCHASFEQTLQQAISLFLKVTEESVQRFEHGHHPAVKGREAVALARSAKDSGWVSMNECE